MPDSPSSTSLSRGTSSGRSVSAPRRARLAVLTPWRSLLAGVTVLAFGLTACATDPQPDDDSGPEVPEGLEEFYDQDLSWEDCEDYDEPHLQCAEVTVPVDYEDPDGETLDIALIADDPDDESHLLTNPGGPGTSGVEMVAERLGSTATEEVREEFTVVGFDPRGVDRSSGVQCLNDEEYDQERQEHTEEESIDEEEEFTEALEHAEDIVDECVENTGEVLGHVDSFSAAADMDILRAVLGEEELHYMGFSYGTKLGMAYAEQFPETVGRFVLDAMMDVSLPADEMVADQAAGFESALEGFAEWCVENDCPVSGDAGDVVEAVQEMFDDVGETPRTGLDGRTITLSTLINGFMTPMYSADGWPLLRDALEDALSSDDFFAFQYWADLQAGREDDGTYDWISTFSFRTIMCLDYPMAETREEMDAEVDEMTERSPTFGPHLGYEGIFCQALPDDPVGEPWEPSEDLPEMLFLGTTGDPATPVQWAEDMHEHVPSSSLVIHDGEGHIASMSGSECVQKPVDEYLITGELFEGRMDC